MSQRHHSEDCQGQCIVPPDGTITQFPLRDANDSGETEALYTDHIAKAAADALLQQLCCSKSPRIQSSLPALIRNGNVPYNKRRRQARSTLLPGGSHMVHHIGPERVVHAIDGIAAESSTWRRQAV